MAVNKHTGSDFSQYLIDGLRESDDLVFLHIKEALENYDTSEPDNYTYLIKAISDVAHARGVAGIADKIDITKQGLYKILNGTSVPSIQNIMSILHSIGLKISVAQLESSAQEQHPASILDVAQYAASLMPRKSTYMQLQKIAYYSQAYSLVNFGKPLFNESIEAWRGGPVIRELYEKHKGLHVINSLAIGNAENLTIEQKISINRTIEKYGKMDGDTLSHLTHLEQPWIEARKGIAEDLPSQTEITLSSMKEFYSQLPDYLGLDEKED